MPQETANELGQLLRRLDSIFELTPSLIEQMATRTIRSKGPNGVRPAGCTLTRLRQPPVLPGACKGCALPSASSVDPRLPQLGLVPSAVELTFFLFRL